MSDHDHYMAPRTEQYGIDYLAAGADIERLLTDNHEHNLLLIRDTYRERIALATRLDRDPDASARTQFTERLAALAEITALQALRANKQLTNMIVASRWMLMDIARTTEGASWADIGAALDMRRQSAQQWYRSQIERHYHAATGAAWTDEED